MPAILSALGWLVAKIFGDNVLRFIATRVLMITLFTIVLPIVLNNLLYDLIDIGFQMTNETVGAGSFSGAISLTGFASWLIGCFKVPECISVITSAMLARFALSMIPFLRV